MKISLKWLNDYVDVKEYFSEPAQLAQLLTGAGLEVEGMEQPGQNFNHVVIAQILERNQHPDADRLTVCKVQVGEGDVRQIVCGAKNHRTGDFVVAALPGAVLPGDFAIKKSKIRGVESEGMLCSEKELGLSSESEGILILPQGSTIGQDFASFWGLDDIYFDLKVTPNRADCLSHIGLAREICALLGRTLKVPETSFTEGKRSTKDLFKVELKDAEYCPRYTGKGILGVKVGPSPQWLRRRLEAVGLKSINNVVDATNYVMMELGQPLHAFDTRHLSGSKIVIARSQVDESFQTLDGTELKLTGEELVIRDGEKPVALAGVVGGLNSGVSESTQDLFIESAYFLASAVRRTCRRYGFETDSAYRFSRGTDPEGVLFALKRACHLIQKIAGGEVLRDHFDLYPQPLPGRLITISLKSVEERLGYPVLESDFKHWMLRLGCQIDGGSGKEGTLKIRPPAFRWDLNIDVDLIEEYGRLNGYDKIPEVLPSMAGAPSHDDDGFTRERYYASSFQAEGFSQAVNYGFTSKTSQQQLLGDLEKGRKLGIPYADEAVVLLNPLTEDGNVMRLSLLPGLVENLRSNFHHGTTAGRLFEVGYGFGKKNEAAEDTNAYHQYLLLGLAVWGTEVDWTKSSSAAYPKVFDLKTAVENFLKKHQVTAYRWENLGDRAPAFLHPGQSVGLFCEGKWVGFLGTLHPEVQQRLKVRVDVALGEFNGAQLLKDLSRRPRTRSISKMPAVERDLAFLIPDNVAVGDVSAEIRKLSGALLQNIEVFDVYKGEGVKLDYRSVALRLTYQKGDSTFSDSELQEMQERIVKGIAGKFSISVR